MTLRSAAALALTALLVLAAPPAVAMEFHAVQDASGAVTILAVGEIRDGDIAHLDAAIAEIGARPVRLVSLASPGGGIVAAMAIASRIAERGWSTEVGYSADCLSACSILFLAGKARLAECHAAIGVHRPTGNATGLALFTFGLERFDAPPDIVGRMRDTPHEQMAVLTREELRRMNVTLADCAAEGGAP